jgi:lambda family phage portal protein
MNTLDKIIEYVNPAVGAKRAAQRAAIDAIRNYDAAGRGRRANDWKATGADANKQLEAALPTLRNRSREQVRNNVYARRTVQAISVNVVGKGIIPTPEYVTRAAEKRIMKLWKMWAGKANRCDQDGLMNFYGIQKLVMRTVVESGECLVVRRRSNSTMLPLKLQVLEPDFIDTTKTNLISQEEGSITMYGIKFDQNGERLGYWLYENHPGSDRMLRLTSKFVKAEDVCHIFYTERPGQVRGVPWMVASMMRMRDFDEYEDAELVRQKIAACFTVFIQDTNPDAVMGDSSNEDIAERVEPGIIELLPPGKSVSFAQPPLTNGYESYSRKILQGISIGTGITYEMMTGDLSNVNFSSGRMGWLEFQRNVVDWQDNMLIPMLCDRVWEWFCEAGEIVGQVKTDTEVSWTPPRREMIDPVKETNALSKQVRNGFLSYSEAVRQMGYDPDDTMEEIQSDNVKFDEKGLVLDCDPRQEIKAMDVSEEDEKEPIED